MRSVLDLVHMVSSTPVNVLIQGENGTGKELIARMIHNGGDRRSGPFVAINCAAIPENLMESEFFGYEQGAFTGAMGSRAGRFEEASGSTLFLDEVGDIPINMQPKFLRAIQEGEGSRLGSNRVMKYDLRLISATNSSLRSLVSSGSFREDLYYRLFAVEIRVPSLRERTEDITPLALAFFDEVCRRYNKTVSGISNDLLTLFERFSWPGNVRQLRREIERLVALTPEGQHLTPDRCSPELLASASAPRAPQADDLSLPNRVRDLELELIQDALERTGGNRVRAAELLGITRQGLHKKLKRYAEANAEAG
jgi:transcriptional regulator with PAS, ATPase and Fis domain